MTSSIQIYVPRDPPPDITRFSRILVDAQFDIQCAGPVQNLGILFCENALLG